MGISTRESQYSAPAATQQDNSTSGGGGMDIMGGFSKLGQDIQNQSNKQMAIIEDQKRYNEELRRKRLEDLENKRRWNIQNKQQDRVQNLQSLDFLKRSRDDAASQSRLSPYKPQFLGV